MNVKKIVVLMLVICLMGCSNEEGKEVDNLLSELGEGTAINNQGQGENYYNDIYKYGESDNAFYYVDRQQMYYFDKNKNNIMLMCTKPECDHVLYKDSQRVYDCEALYANNCYVQVYDGKLYADAEPEGEEVQSIIVSNLDGTQKEVAVSNIEARIEKERERFNSGGIYSYVTSLTWRIYDGIVYVFTNMSADSGENNYFFIDKYDLKSGEYLGEMVNKTFEGNQGYVDCVYKYGDRMILEFSINQGRNGGRCEKFLDINVDSGELAYIDVPEHVTDTLYNGGVVYQKSRDDVYFADGEGETKVCIELNDLEKKCGVIVTRVGENIFITPMFFAVNNETKQEYYMKVYNAEFELIETIELPEEMLPMGGYNQILLRNRSWDKYYGVDGSQIGTGNVEVKEYTMN